MRTALLKCLLICLAVAITGCGEAKKEEPENPTAFPLSWSPDDMSYSCADETVCPDNQGVLFFVTRRTEDFWDHKEYRLWVKRCTGSIYASDKVITAGHCAEDSAAADESFFKTAAAPGRPSRLFHIRKSLGLTRNSADLSMPDFGALELVESAEGIHFAHPSLKNPQNTNEMIALVSNSINGSKNNFAMNALKCSHRPSPLNAISYDKNPTTFLIEECRLVSGNSGGVVVQPTDLLNVLGIAHASNQGDDNVQLQPYYRQAFGTPPPPSAIITNARCFSLPGWDRTEPTCLEMNASVLK